MQAKWFGFYKRTSTTNYNNNSSSVDTAAFKGCKEEYWKVKDLKVMVSQLTVAFNASEVEV